MPIFKKIDIEVALDYRPVSLTSVICKLLEVIKDCSSENEWIQKFMPGESLRLLQERKQHP